MNDIQTRLEYLRGEIEAEQISYGEIAELQHLAAHIEPGDTVLLEWAGVPEEGIATMFPERFGPALPCGCVPHITRTTQWGFHCETEDQGYCNFECPHEDEEDEK